MSPVPRSVYLLLALLASISPGAAPSTASAASVPLPEIREIIWIIPGPTLLDPFRRPRAMAADSARSIFLVADTGNQRLVTFDHVGRSRGLLNLGDDVTTGQFSEPQAVALDRRGRIFTVDALTSDVEVMSSTGSHLGFVVPPLPPELAAEARPRHVAIGASSRIYLLFGGPSPGLVIMEPDGTLVESIGFDPPGEGPWMSPVCVAVNPEESELAVLDPQAERAILVYGTDGTFRAAFGEHGEGDGTFSMAVHVTWGPDGNLWVTDTIRHSISVLDSRGGYVGRIGGFGGAPGEFNYPAASAFLARDQLLVLERAGARCQLVALELEEREGVPAPRPDLAVSDP